MPTPAMHLALAEEMLHGSDLSAVTRRLLHQHQGPFMLGHTAPDVRTVSGQPREACHFYSVPRTSATPAHQALFDANPALERAKVSSPAQMAFVAGYIAHLLLDELWLDDVFQRFLLQGWAPLRERLFLHNVLRTWMDHRAQEALNGTVAFRLREVAPCDWLPFVNDEHLRVWRDWLVEQLAPGRSMETAEVLAGRMGISAQEIEALARSPAQMEESIFCHFPRSALRAFREKGYVRSVALIEWYVGGSVLGSGDAPPADLPVGWSDDALRIEEACP